MFKLKGKTCLVTGGASGIGLACVKHFLSNGAKGVAIVDVDVKGGLEALEEMKSEFGGNKVIFIEVDISNTAQFDGAFKKTVEIFGNIDVLVNNAGIFQEKQWEKMVQLNLSGVIHGCMLGFENYIPKHRSGSEGVIINICSTASIDITISNPIYAATKMGILGFSHSLGNEDHYDRTKVKVICVCPSLTDVPIQKVTGKNFFGEQYFNLVSELLSGTMIQSSSHIAECITNLINKADTGSVWLIQNNEEPYELHIPMF